jgi:hypothetical protein
MLFALANADWFLADSGNNLRYASIEEHETAGKKGGFWVEDVFIAEHNAPSSSDAGSAGAALSSSTDNLS